MLSEIAFYVSLLPSIGVILAITFWSVKQFFCKTIIVFPKNFTISFDNCHKPIKALMEMAKTTKRNKIIRVDFSQVEMLDEITYMLFLAQVEKANVQHKDIYLHGLLQCKSSNVIVRKKSILHNNIDLKRERINALAFSSIQTKQIDDVVLGLNKIGIIKEYYSPLYDLFIELVGNAIEHGIKSRNINWWLHQEVDFKKTSITYAFVDMGSGIVESYRSSCIRNRFKDSGALIISAFDGVLGSTTKQAGRGRGLPQIASMVKNGLISDFLLITNNISLQYKKGNWEIKKIPNFKGTFYTWTINKENCSRWKKG